MIPHSTYIELEIEGEYGKMITHDEESPQSF
jgi:hypothetical protein